MELYPKTDTDTPEDKPESEGAEEKNFLIPKSAFGGECKPGDVYKIKVVSVLDEELEVEPIGKGEDKKEDKPEAETDGSDKNPVDQYMT